MQQVVIMPGGFHPFHAGHYALYQSAREAFPNADVYVAATNDTSTRPFPFQIKEKLAKLAGVEPGHFVQVRSPFQALEITQKFNPEDTQLIFVRSEKDRSKPPQPGGVKKNGEPAYLQPYNSKSIAPMSKHGYMAYLPTVEFGPGMTSATEIRSAWPKLNDKRKTALVMSLYPRTQSNPKLAATAVKMLDTAIGTEVAENQGWAATFTNEADGLTAGFGNTGGMTATWQQRYNQPVDETRVLDPKKVDVFYQPSANSPRNRPIARDIPASTVDYLIQQFIQRVRLRNGKTLKASDFVWSPAQGEEEFGQRLGERDITSKLGTKRDWGRSVRKWRRERGLDEQDYLDEARTDPIESAAVDFYQNQVGDVKARPVDNYQDIARELLQQTDDVSTRRKVRDILVKGKDNPYIQGGIITTVAAIVSGGILTSAARMGLTPQQTNIMLQAILNTVVPTVVSRLNGKSWPDTVKYTLASAGIGTGIAAVTEQAREK